MGRRGSFALFVSLMAAAALLALPSTGAALTTASIDGGMLHVLGSPGPDHTEIRFKPDSKGNPIVQIYDPAGIPDPLPLGCTRKDANTVICPADLVVGVDYHGGMSDDSVIFDFGLFFPFTARSVNTLGTSITLSMDGEQGNDSESMIGPLPSTEIGGPGNDTLVGGSGPDTLIGGPGNDTLKGNDGPDVLNCGGGTDKGVGGSGKDKSKGCEKGKA